jgi:hypothetical protein
MNPDFPQNVMERGKQNHLRVKPIPKPPRTQSATPKSLEHGKKLRTAEEK